MDGEYNQKMILLHRALQIIRSSMDYDFTSMRIIYTPSQVLLLETYQGRKQGRGNSPHHKKLHQWVSDAEGGVLVSQCSSTARTCPASPPGTQLTLAAGAGA